ncbi:MAG: hypothetical protein A2725_02200 [Candidatus Magasanikbacteria bacterium RIFCSPHIGHO2_01_FULL_33_34]|uniref:Uncharacterized protein n=1 Tax=Candidatus Magasanikbacteria bacterium RIFCSPHIGHO2_01_FULL_33_34 TaxID=1798671 RepID=A0A1F6LKB2_9BACT|nr:MAG: hypothetical protein A2725_02200 [Candidatus Magasanikbacteria bacterium RIFCSPHIGHO2_01_FULL_33_34]OGH65579.1 MAG: hypothetical protein A3B83_01775 [Candidatus Magasanikbacteria bacterium RIFCSPHIGHO2_02_FULL_33_17]OGH76290.1 MAG: hypothetical protein A3A89_02595 [Candidatus Magasanikbacteria bacterium RIFCSPLOWO2_01_FULL_33_34]OGH81515.1 MAG: hypothetical protein A3F93_00980 [Candidatus Magasanikbacteria bacterium RIFCSPLOWO2_12_FULL_34_7]
MNTNIPSQNKSKLEKISLGIFLTCMVFCAILFLFVFWTHNDSGNQTLISITATFFVVGLANFLIWLPIVIYRLIEVLKR